MAEARVAGGKSVVKPNAGMIKAQGIDHVSLSVADLDRAIKFYTELFGLKLLRKFGEPRQAYLACGRSLLGLVEVKDYPGLLNISKSRAHVSFYLSKSEFQKAITLLKESDVRVIYGPERSRDGKRLILVDPDENKIELASPRTKM